MKEEIKQLCKDIEKQHNIKILFCIESGSRVWRFESQNSDYDIRFVFVRPIDNYIGINQPDDIIKVGFDKEGNIVEKDMFLDVVGFDIHKFASLLFKSNPNCIEWTYGSFKFRDIGEFSIIYQWCMILGRMG